MQTQFTPQDALNVLQQGNMEQAKAMFEIIACQEPENWFAWFYLASIATQTGHNADAMAHLYRAAELNPEESAIWNNLGTVLRREHHVDRAREIFLKGTELSPDDADLWSNLCTLYVNEGNPEQGLEYANKALKANPEHVNALWNKSLLCLETGRLEEGFKLYAAGIETGERMPRWNSWPTFDPAKHKGKTVLVYGEQGIGDEIMYYSLIPDLMKDAGHVIIECHPRLENIIKRSVPEATVYPTRKAEIVDISEAFDAKMALGDLAVHYRREPADFPRTAYLKADAVQTHKMRERLHERAGTGPYIGIAWRGGYKKTRKDLRSLTLEEMGPIIEMADQMGAKIVSFQYTPDADMEVRQFEEAHGIRIHHWADVVRGDDYDKTAALLECMDITIAVNTSLVHLAGSLGKKLWTLTPRGCAWRYWCWDDKMMWYDSVTQYRAGENKDWSPVLMKVAHDLQFKLQLLSTLEVAK